MPNRRREEYRVLFLRSSPFPGGIERILTWAGEVMRASGVTVGMAVLWRGRGEHPWVAQARGRGLNAWTVPEAHAWDVRPLLALRRIVAHFRPNLVHSHDCRSDFFAPFLGTPWLVTAHGYTRATRKMRLYEALDRRLILRARRIIVPSRYARDELVRMGLPARRIRPIPHGLHWPWVDKLAEVRALAPAPLTPILFLGRHSREKGGDLLLRALHRLGSPPRPVWFVGEGRERRRWERLARELKLGHRVTFWGWQKNPYPFLRAAAFLVVPSLRETFGLSALEAQGMGIPLVASRVGGLEEILVPQGVHFFSPTRDGSEALAKALARMEEEQERFRADARRARPQVRRAYAVEVMAQAYTRLYEEVLDEA